MNDTTLKFSTTGDAAEQAVPISTKIREEQTRALFERGLVATVAATLFAIAMAWVFHKEVPNARAMAWLAAKVAVVLPRIALAVRFARRSDESFRWLTQYRALLLLDGAVWGSGAFLLLPASPAGVAMLVAMLCGVATISTFNLQSDFRSCLVYVAPLLIQIVVMFSLRLDRFGVYGALSISAFLYLLLSAAWRADRRLIELLTLRFSNADLTLALTAALHKSHAEALAKDGFVAGMSHELRTPLHGILGLSRMLHKTVSAADKPTVKLIIRSGEHLLGLINNVLEFSKIKAHGVDIDLETASIDVTRTVEEAVALCEPSALDREVDLRLDFLVARPLVANIDPYRLRQVVFNLVGNAVKFTDKGGSVAVRIEILADNATLVVRVADTGIGMNPSDMEKVFEPFGQADASTTRRHGGTGLGLNITRSICHRLGGDIECSSVLGQGSVFTVTLPLPGYAAEASASAPVSRFSDSGFSDLAQDGHHGTVLLAEDNEVNAIVGEYALARLGVAVAVADNGAAVVARMCTNGARPNLVLLDCQMPVMDGYEATRIVRDYERRHGLPAVPIVALTASVFPSDRDHCREVGMNAFLSKPFADGDLKAVLVRFGVIPREENWSESSYAALLL